MEKMRQYCLQLVLNSRKIFHVVTTNTQIVLQPLHMLAYNRNIYRMNQAVGLRKTQIFQCSWPFNVTFTGIRRTSTIIRSHDIIVGNKQDCMKEHFIFLLPSNASTFHYQVFRFYTLFTQVINIISYIIALMVILGCFAGFYYIFLSEAALSILVKVLAVNLTGRRWRGAAGLEEQCLSVLVLSVSGNLKLVAGPILGIWPGSGGKRTWHTHQSPMHIMLISTSFKHPQVQAT